MFWLCVGVFLLGLNIAVEGGYCSAFFRLELSHPLARRNYKDHNILSTMFCFAL